MQSERGVPFNFIEVDPLFNFIWDENSNKFAFEIY